MQPLQVADRRIELLLPDWESDVLTVRRIGHHKIERETRLELATPTLARLCSTNWAISACCAQDETRTHTALLPLPPQSSVYTNFTTCATFSILRTFGSASFQLWTCSLAFPSTKLLLFLLPTIPKAFFFQFFLKKVHFRWKMAEKSVFRHRKTG